MSQNGVRPEKRALQREIRERLEGAAYVVLTDYTGLNMEDMTALRGALRERGSRLNVVRNTFFVQVAGELGWGDPTPLLDGPTAMVWGAGDVTATARALKDFGKRTGRAVMRGGFFGDRLLTAEDMDALASIPSREVLLGQVVGTLAAPLYRLAGVMQQKVLSLLYVLKAVEDKKQR
ncbi:MAG: 50S ribosomal protein L10 [Lentisphaerae bacterium]|nr:50S ribosomal protein L10 [Lentisphaerota bacterium]